MYRLMQHSAFTVHVELLPALFVLSNVNFQLRDSDDDGVHTAHKCMHNFLLCLNQGHFQHRHVNGVSKIYKIQRI